MKTDMRYRMLGRTGLMVSEIGLGAEWLERHSAEEVKTVVDRCEEAGINILDCWMPEPKVRSNIGAAIRGRRERWIIQGHLGATWQNGQYVRTREMKWVKEAFADLLARLETDYIDLGMLHFVDEVREFHQVMEGEFYAYAAELKAEHSQSGGGGSRGKERKNRDASVQCESRLRHASGQRRYDGIFQRRLRGGTGRNCA